MKEVRDATARILDNTTLAGLNAQVARAGGRKKRDLPKTCSHLV